MAILRPVLQPVLRPALLPLGERRRGSVLSALSGARLAIEQDARDVNILVLGDSTGNDSSEWVYLFAQWLAAEYPTHSVDYYLWGGSAYGSATLISTGSGANTINVWNGSVAGQIARYFAGELLDDGVVSPSPDLIIWSYGHNYVTQIANQYVRRGDFYSATETVRQAAPNAAHAFFLQNPRRDDDEMASVVTFVREVAQAYGDVTLLDAYARFMAAGKDADLYLDNQHPSAAGTQLFLQSLTAKWRASKPAAFDAAPALTETLVENLLLNGDFSAFDSAAPDNWAPGAGATVEKDTEVFDAEMGDSYSVKVTGTVASLRIQQALATEAFESVLGKTVTLAVREFIPSGQPSNAGRICVLIGSTLFSDISGQTGGNGWRWRIVSGVEVPADVESVSVALFANSSSSAGTTAYFGRAVLVEGDIPRDMA